MEEDVFPAAESIRIIYPNRKRKYGVEHLEIPLLKHDSRYHGHAFTSPSDLTSEKKKCRNDTFASEDEPVPMSSEENSTFNNYSDSVSFRNDGASFSPIYNLTNFNSDSLELSAEATSIPEEFEFLTNNALYYHHSDSEDEPQSFQLCMVCKSLKGASPTADHPEFCQCHFSGAQAAPQKTIDKEFEEYFSMLML